MMKKDIIIAVISAIVGALIYHFLGSNSQVDVIRSKYEAAIVLLQEDFKEKNNIKELEISSLVESNDRLSVQLSRTDSLASVETGRVRYYRNALNKSNAEKTKLYNYVLDHIPDKNARYISRNILGYNQ